jgi:hypothetical protein
MKTMPGKLRPAWSDNLTINHGHDGQFFLLIHPLHFRRA